MEQFTRQVVHYWKRSKDRSCVIGIVHKTDEFMGIVYKKRVKFMRIVLKTRVWE
jgi:hypothetical protein